MLTQVELNQRIRDIFLSMLRLTPEAKVGLSSMDERAIRLMELWTHVLEEMVLRFGPHPAGFGTDILHSEPLPDFVGPLAGRTASALDRSPRGSVMIKFGRPEHMRALFERGALRVQSASFFRRPHHNGAVRDDELALQLSLSLNREQVVRMVSNPQDIPPTIDTQRIDVRCESTTDYWLYCVTTAVEPRLFVDFEAEACVVIKDPARFRAALNREVGAVLRSTVGRDGKVAYVDPLLPTADVIDVPMSKHFRYAYQDEYRFVWLPPSPRWDLAHIDVEIGSLSEYAELIVV